MKIHWFGVTVKCDYDFALELWKYFFDLELGHLVNSPRGGYGFQHMDIALQEARLYWSPIPQSSINYDYVYFEFPGSACDAMLPVRFQEFYKYMRDNEMGFKITRLDLAFDDCPFTPKEFFDKALIDDCFTHAKRETFNFTTSPEYLRGDGSKGSDSCYIGSRSSARFLRVYDERGFTRSEIVLRDDRANQVSEDLFARDYQEWEKIGKSHLLDFIRFQDWQAWHDFINNVDRADLIVSAARRVSLTKIRNWLSHQVAPALSVIYDVLGEEETMYMLRQMITDAREKRDRSRYSSVLSLRYPFQEIENISLSMFSPEFSDDWDLVDPPHDLIEAE